MLFDIFGNLIQNTIEKFTETNLPQQETNLPQQETKQELNNEYLQLIGDISTTGIIKAKDFIKNDGSSLTQLPKNLKIEGNKTEVIGDFTANGEFVLRNGNDIVYSVNKEGNTTIKGNIKVNKSMIGNDPNGFVELRGGTPYIDFSHHETEGDFDNRIILQNKDLTVTGNMNINKKLNTPNIERVNGDWLRINQSDNSVGQTALYGNLSINDIKNNKGGLAVGSWTSPGRGNASISGGVRIGDTGSPDQWGNRGLHVRNQDGRWTHFNWHGDNKNYIRGHTQVDGNVNTNGNISATDSITVSQARNEGGRLRIVNPNKKEANTTQDWSIWNMTGGYGNKLSFWRYNGDGKNAGSLMDLHDAGSVSVNGNMKVNGTQLCIGDRWCINAEGDHLVFRDNKSDGDKRYAMFAGNYKDL